MVSCIMPLGYSTFRADCWNVYHFPPNTQCAHEQGGYCARTVAKRFNPAGFKGKLGDRNA